MATATNPQVVTTNGSYTVPPQWRNMQIENLGTGAATVVVTPGNTNDPAVTWTIPSNGFLTVGMGGSLPDANLNASNAATYHDGYTWQINHASGATTLALNPTKSQSESIGWTAQSTNATGQINTVAVTVNGGNVVLSWL